MTLNDLALAVGTDAINISRLERGLQGYTDKTLRAIARALGVGVIDLFDRVELQAHSEGAPAHFSRVRILEEVSGDAGGCLQEVAGDYGGPASVTFPTRNATAYGLRIRGDGLRPRVKSGEFVIVEPDIEAANGDDVVLTLKDGRRFLKQLLYRRGSEVSFGSVNESGHTFTIHEDEIEDIHFVAGIVQRAPG